MSPAARVEPSPSNISSPTQSNSGPTREQTIESAFETIFNLYDNENELAKALTNARKVVTNLEKALASLKRNMHSVNSQLNKTVCEVTQLREVVLRLPISPKNMKHELGVTKGLSDIAIMLENTVKDSYTYTVNREQMGEHRMKIDKAKRFVKMLEGAKAVADAGGMKRGRDEDPQGDSRNARKIPKRTDRAFSSDEYDYED